MSNTESPGAGGRPKNVNEREMREAIEPLLARIAALEGAPPQAGGEEKANVPLSRGWFFMHLMTGMCIHRGEAAFNRMFLETIQNNADDFYETYCHVVRGTHTVQSSTKQLLEDTQQRLRVIERERLDLSSRIQEMEREAAILRGDKESAEAEEPVEAKE